MTFYGKCTAFVKSKLSLRMDIDPTRNNELSSTIFTKYNNRTIKKSFEVIVLTLINKKTNKELFALIGKIGIRFHLSHSHVF